MVIKRLIELIGFNRTMKINICPTLREEDGLAMSSRNVRLLPDDRPNATTIFASLRYIKENIKEGNLTAIKESAQQMLLKKGFKVDYIEIADANTLELIEKWDGKQKIVVLAAAFLGNVRLIDNMVIDP